jgi:AcrR family transcriptional regulator
MGRRELYSSDTILDAARAVVVERGVRAATVAAIAQESQAPPGSIYHRFRSIEEVLARLWIRAVRRSQEAAVIASDEDDPLEAVVSAALGSYDFCLDYPEDARLLALFRREDFLSADLPGELHEELLHVNDAALGAAREAAKRLFGRASRSAVDLVLAAAVDVPYGLARPYLEAQTTPPPQRRDCISGAARAILRRDRG